MHAMKVLVRFQSIAILFLALVAVALALRDPMTAALYSQAQPGSVAYALSDANTSTSLTTQFAYQGSLATGGEAANGDFSFQVSLYDAATEGQQLGLTNSFAEVEVTDGVFSLSLDFGDVFNGGPRWLEIAVQGPDDDEYTTLSPRQAINPMPYALYAESTLEDWLPSARSADQETGEVMGNLILRTYDDSFPGSEIILPAPDSIITIIRTPMTPKLVEAVYFTVPTRSGDYDGEFVLEFQVRGYDGSVKRTMSAEPVDLTALTAGTQVREVSLSDDPADRMVYPGEYLAAFVQRTTDAGGDLSLSVSFSATARNAVMTEAENGE